jgi:hypothetical protein
MEELRGPRSFVPLIAQRPCCAIFFLESTLDMTIREPFTPRTPDPDKAPRPPTQDQPAADKPGRPILLPSKSKAAFRGRQIVYGRSMKFIGHPGWDRDA